MQNFKEVFIEDLFDVLAGQKNKVFSLSRTQTYNIPIYSSQSTNDGIVGYTDIAIFNADEKDVLVTFGDHTRKFFIRRNPFSISDNVKVLRLKNHFALQIDIEYFIFTASRLIPHIGYARHWSEAKKTSIPIPAIGDQFDLLRQKQIALKYRKIQKIKERLNDAYKVFKKVDVVVPLDKSSFDTFELGNEEVFKCQIGSRVLKKDIEMEGVPIYSANVFKPFGFSNKLEYKKFDKPVLIWGIDGDFDWNIIPQGMKFIPTDHCGVLEINSNVIDIDYLLYELRATKAQYGFDRTYRASLENIKNVSVQIPNNLEIQKNMVIKYKKLEKIQNYLIENLKFLKDVNVSI